jgi:hypothetical protein
MTDRRLDQSRAINLFLTRFPDLSCLPFITDEEMEALYGEEVAGVLRESDTFNQQEHLCRNCRDSCCQLVRCEIYSPQFKQCPARSYRPPICRLHFCHSFIQRSDLPLNDLGDIFLAGWQAAEKLDRLRATLLDCPPFRRIVPELSSVFKGLMSISGADPAREAEISRGIRSAIEQYRSLKNIPGAAG